MTQSALMMAAMMLPGAVPAAVRTAHADHGTLVVPRFAGSYFALWALLGLALYAVHQPGTAVAGAITVAAGIYELTPLKRECRRRCREQVGSGVRFGVWCAGSSIGLMLALVAIGAMSFAWVSVFAAIVLAQKVLRPHPAFDIPLALAIVALGVLIVAAPTSVPGVMPSGM